MWFLSPLAILSLVGFSCAIALPEPIRIELDIEATDGEHKHMREISGNTLAKLQQAVKELEEPGYHGKFSSYPFLISLHRHQPWSKH